MLQAPPALIAVVCWLHPSLFQAFWQGVCAVSEAVQLRAPPQLLQLQATLQCMEALGLQPGPQELELQAAPALQLPQGVEAPALQAPCALSGVNGLAGAGQGAGRGGGNSVQPMQVRHALNGLAPAMGASWGAERASGGAQPPQAPHALSRMNGVANANWGAGRDRRAQLQLLDGRHGQWPGADQAAGGNQGAGLP